jgi:hypothetical protein
MSEVYTVIALVVLGTVIVVSGCALAAVVLIEKADICRRWWRQRRRAVT